jgi:hypothetical protein
MQFKRFFKQSADLFFSKLPHFFFKDTSNIFMTFFAIFINLFKSIGTFLMYFVLMIKDFLIIIQEFLQIV